MRRYLQKDPLFGARLPKCQNVTQKFAQTRKTLVNVLSRGIWCCLKRERDIERKAMLASLNSSCLREEEAAEIQATC